MHAKKITVLLFCIIGLLILSPSRYFDSVAQGVRLFVYSVLPSMLPFFFFTKLLTASGGAYALTKTIGKPIGKAYGVSGACGYAFVMSVLSGYPVGARVLGDLFSQGYVTKEDVRRASSFCSTSGSMFVLGSIGAVILKDGTVAWLILICHYLGAVLNGLVFCRFGKKKGGVALPALSVESADDRIASAMYESVISLALVGGYIAVCNLAADMASDVLLLLGVKLGKASPVTGAFYSLFEVTRGCVTFSSCALTRAMKAALCCASVSFGGISVLFQSVAFLGKSGVGVGRLFLIKGVQATLSFGLCLLAGSFFL